MGKGVPHNRNGYHKGPTGGSKPGCYRELQEAKVDVEEDEGSGRRLDQGVMWREWQIRYDLTVITKTWFIVREKGEATVEFEQI